MAIDVAKHARPAGPTATPGVALEARGRAGGEARPWALSFRRSGVTRDDLVVFSRQLALLLQTGNALVPSVEALSTMFHSPRFRGVLEDVHGRMEEGRGFSDALARHPRVFDDTFVSLVRAGEASGALRASLERVAELLEIHDRLRKRTQEAMIYPTLLLCILSAVVFFMTTFVLPRFAQVFEDFDAELPALTRAVLFATDTLRSSWPFLIPMIPLSIVALRKVLRTRRAREALDEAKLKLPLVGRLYSEAYLFQMFVSLGMLLGTRVPLLDAIKITRGTVRNARYDGFFSQLADSVEEGRGMALPFSRAPFLPDAVKLMITTGESTGALDVVMVRLAERYRDALESDIRRLSSVIEPVMLVLMGIVVGTVVISLILPLFKLSQAVR